MDLRTGAAFWPLRDGLPGVYPPLDRDERADIVVIGAGVTGALVADRLVAAGANVVVLDKRDVASGSTAATTGLLQYETDSSLLDLRDHVGVEAAVRAYRLGVEAVDTIERLTQDMGDPCGFARRPSLYLASSRRDARSLTREHALRREHGFDVVWLSQAELAERYGIDAPGGLYSQGSAEIDAYRLTHRLLARAVDRGARVYDRSEVTRVDPHDTGVTVETDRGPRVDARRLVWATGYEAVEDTQKRVGRQFSTWAVASEPIPDLGPWRDRELIWETARPYLYARVSDDGRALIGGEDERFSNRHASDRRLARKTQTLVAGLTRLFPMLEIEPAYSWAGVFTTTKDGLPYIGETSDHPHAWLALGYGGNGITFSVIAANIIRDAWCGAPNPDARIFAFER